LGHPNTETPMLGKKQKTIGDGVKLPCQESIGTRNAQRGRKCQTAGKKKWGKEKKEITDVPRGETDRNCVNKEATKYSMIGNQRKDP